MISVPVVSNFSNRPANRQLRASIMQILTWHSEIYILTTCIYIRIYVILVQVKIVKFPPFTTTANDALRARQAFATKKSISISHRAITRSNRSLFLARAPSPSYISISAKETERDRVSLRFVCFHELSVVRLEIEFSLIERLQGTLRRNAREVTEKRCSRYNDVRREYTTTFTKEMYKKTRRIRMLVSGAATYDFIGCLPLRCLDESKDMIFES